MRVIVKDSESLEKAIKSLGIDKDRDKCMNLLDKYFIHGEVVNFYLGDAEFNDEGWVVEDGAP